MTDELWNEYKKLMIVSDGRFCIWAGTNRWWDRLPANDN